MSTDLDNDIIRSARKLAFAEYSVHKHGGLPYAEYHLVAVVGVVACFSRDPEVIAAAWLHDIVEDCPDIDLEVVERMTTPRVAHLVDLLTDPPGPRAASKAISLPRVASDVDACLIKGADRYHNHASTIMQRHPKFSQVYHDEFPQLMQFIGNNLPRGLVEMLMDQYIVLGNTTRG